MSYRIMPYVAGEGVRDVETHGYGCRSDRSACGWSDLRRAGAATNQRGTTDGQPIRLDVRHRALSVAAQPPHHPELQPAAGARWQFAHRCVGRTQRYIDPPELRDGVCG